MAAGLPIIGNEHPSSPIKHGVSGLLSNDPAELRRHAETLLGDRELARKLGQAARQTAEKMFSRRQFVVQFALDRASATAPCEACREGCTLRAPRLLGTALDE